MLIAMVVIFAICWLPLNIVHMVAEFHRSELRHYKVLFLSTHVIAMSSTIYNPFLYSWLNDNFRKEFQQILPCLFKVCWCLNRRHTTHQSTQLSNVGDADIYGDRPSTYQMPAESTIATYTQHYSHVRNSLSNGKLNGSSLKKHSHHDASLPSPIDESSTPFIPGHEQQEMLLMSDVGHSNHLWHEVCSWSIRCSFCALSYLNVKPICQSSPECFVRWRIHFSCLDFFPSSSVRW